MSCMFGMSGHLLHAPQMRGPFGRVHTTPWHSTHTPTRSRVCIPPLGTLETSPTKVGERRVTWRSNGKARKFMGQYLVWWCKG